MSKFASVLSVLAFALTSPFTPSVSAADQLPVKFTVLAEVPAPGYAAVPLVKIIYPNYCTGNETQCVFPLLNFGGNDPTVHNVATLKSLVKAPTTDSVNLFVLHANGSLSVAPVVDDNPSNTETLVAFKYSIQAGDCVVPVIGTLMANPTADHWGAIASISTAWGVGNSYAGTVTAVQYQGSWYNAACF